MNVQSQVQEDVSIFWDLDTASLSTTAASSISAYDVVKNIRTAVLPFGHIKSLRAFWDFSGLPVVRCASLRSELASSGVTLVDCPGEGRKGAAVKRMLVDLICHAWDHRIPHTFVIISGDRDIAYAVSTLRLRKYRVVVMSPATAHPDLTSQASARLDWTGSVLGINGGAAEPRDTFDKPPAPSALPSSFSPSAPPLTPRLWKASSNGFGQPHDAHNAELHDLPLRGRRNSLFSKPYDPHYDIFGGLGDTFTVPPKNLPSFGDGSGSLFPAGKQSRADSAPPNVSHDLAPPPMAPYHRSRDLGQEPAATTTSKGKERAFPIHEPEEIALQAPLVSGNSVPYSWSVFEPFRETHLPFQAEKASSVRASSVSTTSSTGDSTLSMLQHPEPSTAPTSAEHEPDNKEAAFRQSMAEDTVDTPTLKMARTPSPLSSRRHSDAVTFPSAGKADLQVGPVVSSTTRDGSNKATQTTGPPTPESKPVASAPAAVKSDVPTTVQPPLPASHLPGFASISTAANRPAQSPSAASASTAAAGPSTATGGPSTRTTRAAPPLAWTHLADTLRRAGGSATINSLPTLLLQTDKKPYKKAGVSKYNTYLAAAVNAGIVRRVVDKAGTKNIFLNAPYA